MSLPHHDWQRSFVGTETASFGETDMWGRHVRGEHVVCHTRPVCSRCGAVGHPAECICDKQQADRCAFRLDGLKRSGGV
jgi:hypothetical protein